MRLLPLLAMLLASPANAAPAFLLAWGTQGTASGQFDRPHTIALGPTGNVYVADERIQAFTPDGVFLAQWPITCAGFAVDAQSRIVAAHPGGINQVSIHDASGVEVARWGATGTGPGQFRSPYDVALDDSGHVYVTDYSNHRVQVFDASGAFLRTWGSQGSAPGQFLYPAGITIGAQGHVFVAENNNHRVQEFTRDGMFVAAFGSFGTAPGQFDTPNFLGADTRGNVFVCDQNNSRIQVFAGGGAFRTWWGGLGSGPGAFRYPNDVAVDDLGHSYVADTDNHRVQKFAPDASPVLPTTFGRIKSAYRR